MALIESIIFILIFLFCLYKYGTSKHNYFKKLNIPYEKPIIVAGSFKDSLLRKASLQVILIRLHEKFLSKVYGVFQGNSPIIVLKDPELIKLILIKDFDHFTNHQAFLSAEDDPLFGNALTALKDEKWKDMRSTLSPAFTGSKMRLMFELIRECSEETLTYLNGEIKIKNNKNEIDLDMKDIFTRYTNDVIASTAFGLKVNSFVDKDNEFYKKAQKATKVTAMATIKVLMFIYMKPIMKFLKIKLIDPDFIKYFILLVTDTMKYREENNIIRHDMIKLLMEAKTQDSSTISTSGKIEITTQRKWSTEEMVAQCFLFFFAGFETVALLLCFASHELMENIDVQEKLFEEINESKTLLSGKPLTYDILQKMKYLDMVVSETLRKWPPAMVTDRICTKNYKIKKEELEVEIKTNDMVWVNIVGMHYDPDNFIDPKKFDPERFNDDNKVNIKPFSYAPFGLGPRSCIASRLAVMEAKTLLFYLVSEFKIEKNEKSTIPLQLDPKSIQMQPKNGFQLKLSKRG